MKKTYRILAAAALLAGTSAAMAAPGAAAVSAGSDLKVHGDVRAASAYNFRGHAFSAGEPSIGASIGAHHASGLYGGLSTNTVKLGDLRTGDLGVDKSQLHNALTLGYARPVGDIGLRLGGGVTRHAFTGRGHAGDLSFSELFATAQWQGAHAKLSTVVESADLAAPGFARGDVYGELGYTYRIGKYSLGGDVGYGWYDGKHAGAKDGLALAQLRAGYNFTPELEVQLTHQLAWGDNAYGLGSSGNNKTYVTATYRF